MNARAPTKLQLGSQQRKVHNVGKLLPSVLKFNLKHPLRSSTHTRSMEVFDCPTILEDNSMHGTDMDFRWHAVLIAEYVQFWVNRQIGLEYTCRDLQSYSIGPSPSWVLFYSATFQISPHTGLIKASTLRDPIAHSPSAHCFLLSYSLKPLRSSIRRSLLSSQCLQARTSAKEGT